MSTVVGAEGWGNSLSDCTWCRNAINVFMVWTFSVKQMSDFAYPELPTFISAKNFPLCSLPYTHTHTHTPNFSQTREHRCPKKNASWSMMIFIVVSCLKLGLDILVQKLENIKDFGTLMIHIWLFLSTGSLSTESTNSNSEVFEKKFQKVSKKKNLNLPCTWQILGLPQ